MIIAAKLVKQRTNHICSGCMKEIVGEALRVFGSSGTGDKPYTIYSHPTCARAWRDKKIQEALG